MTDEEVIETVKSHDKSIVLMAKAVEDNSKMTTSILEEIKSSREDTIRHYAKQDAISSSYDRVAKAVERVMTRIEKIETKQNGLGCNTFNMFHKDFVKESARINDLTDYTKGEVDKGVKQRERLDKEIVALREQSSVHRNRIKDLEEESKDHRAKAEDSKTKFIFIVVAMVVGLVGSYIKHS